MGPATQYTPVGPNDHIDEEISEEHELEVKFPLPEEGIEASDRLLPQPQEEDDIWEEVTLSSRRKRRSGWLVCLLALLGLLGLFVVLIGFARVFFSRVADKGTFKSFQRPESEYVLGMDWDFKAPPKVREYHWVIREIDADPDGVMKHMLTINGKFPGELIRCNEGDTIVVNVDNQATNATAIHWHGIFQNGTNEMDGVPGITQCPVAPGRKFRYEFTVRGQAGTYFYHGHMAAQASDGLVGPIVVHARDEKKNQPVSYVSDRVVMMQDWYYDSSHSLLMEKLSPGNEAAPIPNGALINGLGKADCSFNQDRVCNSSSAVYPTMDLSHEQNHRLRLLNVGAYAWFQVSVDQHPPLSLIEIDGTTISPAQEDSPLIGPGQRYSVILTTNPQSTTNSFWFRARMLKHCFGEVVQPASGFEEVKAILSYPSSPSHPPTAPSLPTTSINASLPYAVECQDPPPQRYTPSPPLPAPEAADLSIYLRVNLEIGDWRLQRGVLNESSFRANLTSPSLHRVLDSSLSFDTALFDPKSQLTVTTKETQTIDVLLQNFDEGNHPFHLHGHVFSVLASGHGYFPGYEEYNMRPGGAGLIDPTNKTVIENPVRRDVATVEGFGWTWLRFTADNPGVWLFHCHMLWHGESGMGMQFVSRTGDWTDEMVRREGRELCAGEEGEMLRGATPGDEIWVGVTD